MSGYRSAAKTTVPIPWCADLGDRVKRMSSRRSAIGLAPAIGWFGLGRVSPQNGETPDGFRPFESADGAARPYPKCL